MREVKFRAWVMDIEPNVLTWAVEGSDSDGWSHGKWYGWKAGANSLLDVASVCEVIGNIWENGDLLK